MPEQDTTTTTIAAKAAAWDRISAALDANAGHSPDGLSVSAGDVCAEGFALQEQLRGDGVTSAAEELRDAVVSALRDGHRNDSAAEQVANVCDVIGWSEDDDPVLLAEQATDDELRARATCSACGARTDRGERCTCPDGGDAEDYVELRAALDDREEEEEVDADSAPGAGEAQHGLDTAAHNPRCPAIDGGQ